MKRIAAILFSIMPLCVVAWPGVLVAALDYPSRAITMIVPFPAGGVTDLSARALADSMEKHLKQSVVVVNKVGGRTLSGGYAVASAKPDGYTLGFFAVAAAIPEAFVYFQDAPYSSKDLKAICNVVATAYTITVKDDAPWKTLKELIEYAKKNPGIKAGTGGKGTLGHMLLTTFNNMEKTGFVSVPFTGDPPNLAALLGGHTQVASLTSRLRDHWSTRRSSGCWRLLQKRERNSLRPSQPLWSLATP